MSSQHRRVNMNTSSRLLPIGDDQCEIANRQQEKSNKTYDKNTIAPLNQCYQVPFITSTVVVIIRDIRKQSQTLFVAKLRQSVASSRQTQTDVPVIVHPLITTTGRTSKLFFIDRLVQAAHTS